MGLDPPIVEVPRGVSTPGGTADVGHGPQTPDGQDLGVPIYWISAGSGWIGVDLVIYCPPPDHGSAIHCDLSYHGLVFGGGADSGNAPIQVVVVTAVLGYHGD